MYFVTFSLGDPHASAVPSSMNKKVDRGCLESHRSTMTPFLVFNEMYPQQRERLG